MIDSQRLEEGRSDRILASFLEAMLPSWDSFNSTISDNDEMFLMALENTNGDRTQAAIRYHGNGLRIFQAIQQIITHHFGSWDNLSTFLDFAGGYGRFTRFLNQVLAAEKIWISDIYPEAVQFQIEQFQVQGVLSTLTPTEYKINQSFECILASSFFSHIPESTFIPWLKTLYQHLNEGGLLIFSTHDVTLAPNPFSLSASGFHFIPESESRTLDASVYGTTYVSEEFIQHALYQILGPSATYHRIPKGLADHQDLYIISKNSSPEWSNFTFTYPPQGSLESTALNSSGDWEFKGKVWSLNSVGAGLSTSDVQNQSIAKPAPTPAKSIELWVNDRMIHRCVPRGEGSWVCHLNHTQVQRDDVVMIKAIGETGNLERMLVCQTLEQLASLESGHSSGKGLAEGIFILGGMHRSGTSLTASLLNNLGVHLGDRLVATTIGNDRGHFEDLDFVEFHQNVLRSQGLEIDGLTLESEMILASRYYQSAKLLLKEKTKRALWGWKDPRTTLFLKFWAELLPSAYLILVYRSPWEVVDSLYRRGSDEVVAAYPEKAVELWLHYNRQMLEFARTYPERCFLANLDAIVAHPTAWIQAIEEKWQLSLGAPDTSVIEPELLRRDVSQTYKPALIQAFFPEAIKLYKELETLAGSWGSTDSIMPADLDLEAELAKIQSLSPQDWAFRSWQDVGSASKYQKLLKIKQKELEQQAEELRRMRSQYEESEYHKSLIQKKMQEHKALSAQSQAQAEQYKHMAYQLRSQLEQANYHLEQTQQELNQSHAEAVNINQQLINTNAELEQTHKLSADIQAQLNAQLQDLNSQLHHRNLELAAIKANKAWRLRMKWVQLKKNLGLIKE
ncbi:methyltransferase domain-containing protein [Roseofilum sp. BLCC_M91]|uniref:Methyltransferase domain-containing protein n=1 Tax=Roseofilum halophilum BLCC-M91 TaxID=3022259 RepID=A0ABT7BIH8_9CYAN|nr:methyltransferase domain-containing protein [Roseofilum halophilum]MDJ1178993.1 methyltransferase domain-containing protein [Roseofilum halophilum BLCC-M91]